METVAGRVLREIGRAARREDGMLEAQIILAADLTRQALGQERAEAIADTTEDSPAGFADWCERCADEIDANAAAKREAGALP